jgi:hypothetical protein
VALIKDVLKLKAGKDRVPRGEALAAACQGAVSMSVWSAS